MALAGSRLFWRASLLRLCKLAVQALENWLPQLIDCLELRRLFHSLKRIKATLFCSALLAHFLLYRRPPCALSQDVDYYSFAHVPLTLSDNVNKYSPTIERWRKRKI